METEVEEILAKYEAGERNFSGVIMCEVNFSRANLSGANFSNATLSLTNFSGANLSGVNLANAKLNVARFSGANMTNANLQGSILNVANLIRADLTDALLNDATLIRTEMIRANLTRANLEGANLRESDLREAMLKQVNLVRADISGAKLRGANLMRANLEKAILHRTDLSRADLRYVNFTDTEARQVNLSLSNLSEADLQNTNLRWADLSGANLTGANLALARLSGANLYGANLNRANLTNAVLVHADLTQANLIDVSWMGADLTGATLTGAKLHGASRFNLKADDITCEWVDLTPTGDRTEILHLTPEEAQQFFNATSPTVAIVIDATMDYNALFLIARFYRQLALEYKGLTMPPSIEVGQKQTILSFSLTKDADLFLTAFLVILPFQNFAKIQHNIIDLINTLFHNRQQLEVRLANYIGKMRSKLKNLSEKYNNFPPNHWSNWKAVPNLSLFYAKSQLVITSSNGYSLTLYDHGGGANQNNDLLVEPSINQSEIAVSEINLDNLISFMQSFQINNFDEQN